jgi:prepilin-type N-terminal cleavage/methylation domain-containing protein
VDCKPKKELLKNASGFSLIEVLMSIVILAVGLLGISLMQAHFADGNASSRQMIRATDVAMDHIEDLTNISNLGDEDLNTGFHTKTITTYPIDYEVDWTVTDNGDGTLSIEITVRWEENEQDHSFNFSWVKRA